MKSVVFLAFGLAAVCGAQDRVIAARPATATVAADSGQARTSSRMDVPGFRHLQLQSFVLSRLDDNVNRDTLRVASVGVISGLGAQLVSGPVRPWLVAEYDAAFHRYTATNRFNRVSQRGRLTVGGRLTRWWTLEMVSEGSLKGSFEDRDVSDQVTLQPRTEFKLGDARRVRFTASHRWRRYPESPDQDAINQYAAAEFRHRLPDGASWESEFRVERNQAHVTRFDYRRTTWNSTYTTPLWRGATLEVEMQYRLQAYSNRLVEIEDEDVLRRDHRLQPGAAFSWQMGPVQLELSYEPEWRRSNDPTRNIDQHVLLMGLRHRW
ncbi:MAG: hypothetical protein IPK85_24570 [Gemmatimonadetes bacterium]|nr:hypothetical protein [Gemmatimonadota bacterium]